MPSRELRRIPLSFPEEAIRAIEEDGGVILTNFTTTSGVEEVNNDMAPFMSAEDLDSPQAGRTNCSLVYGRSKVAREDWLNNDDLLTVVNHFLRTTDFQWGAQRSQDALISMAFTILTKPGTDGTGYHRDDHIWQTTHKSQEASGYKKGSDLGINLMVPGTDSSKEIGATKIIPGSHLWGDEHEADPADGVHAEMKMGEAFVFLASAVHAGSPNLSAETRIMHTFFFCRGWVRQEDNQFVWWKREEVEEWSEKAQKLAGYIGNTDVGSCNFKQPLDALRLLEPIAA